MYIYRICEANNNKKFVREYFLNIIKFAIRINYKNSIHTVNLIGETELFVNISIIYFNGKNRLRQSAMAPLNAIAILSYI